MKVPVVLLFWIAFVLTRPLGAIAGDLLTKPVTKVGLDLGTAGSSAVLPAVLINGYAYADNNPVTKSDPDGLQVAECWEGTAVCRGGVPVAARPPTEIDPDRALTEGTVRDRRVIYDERGVPHTLGARTNNVSEQVAFDYMNEDLRNGGKYYDGSKNGSGTRYLWQDDKALPRRGLMHGPNGDHVAAGTTADFIRVTWKNGKIVAVDTWDANESRAVEFNAGNVADTVSNKMNLTAKGQTQNVV